MTASEQTMKLAVLFADISGSAALYTRLGDESARRLVTNCLSLMAQKVTQFQGTLVKTIGDEMLCTFPSATSALEAARAMQMAVENGRPGGDHPMSIRIGFHYGDVISNEADIYGDTVNVAARVTAITRARQIMTTRAAVDALPTALHNRVRPITRAEFRGKQEALDVFQVTWEQDDTMTTRIGILQSRKPTEARNELLLRYGQQVLTLNDKNKEATIGRGENCHLVVNNNLASRQHAHIELNFNKFVLADHSANGTFVRFSDGHIIQLIHQEIILHGSGTISPGQSFAEKPGDLIEFIMQ
ncbi:MAG: adenylate/guanylate cyclase domain-containing protein [Gallionellaceae bacterium]|nr:adenylate/guanylate cyclase domain-containing protein [Gallionellaceae bacterium]